MPQNSTRSVKPRPLLPELNDLAVKIKAQTLNLERNPTGPDAKALETSITRNLNEYITLAIQGLREQIIYSDPFGIVYNRGFVDGTVGQKIASSIIYKMMQEDKTGFVASIQIQGGEEMGKNAIGILQDGVYVVYEHATKTLKLIKNQTIIIVDYIKQKLIQLWNWIKSLFERLFSSNDSTIPVRQAA